MRHSLPIPLLVLVFCSTATSLAACDVLTRVVKPTIVIVSPPSNSTYHEGDQVAIRSTSSDATGVTRVELSVDGAVVRNDTAASAQTSVSIVQSWKATPGTHTLVVRAYNAAGIASDPAAISIQVNPSIALNPTPTATAAPAAPPSTSAPPPPTAPPAPNACTNNAAFVTDVTAPDGTSVPAGQPFNKIWRLSNNGTCAWGAGYQLVFVSGEAMTSSTAVAAPSTAPGATADISVSMTAPTTPGNHTGTWRMRTADGAVFGQSVTVKISVPGAPPPAPPPASSGCSGAPSIAAFAATPGTITVGGSSTLSWGAVTNADSVEIDHGIGGVAAPGSTSVSPDSTTPYTITAHCGSNTATLQATVTVNPIILPPPPLPPPVFIGNFGGHWVTNFGWMDITQNGANATGTYHNSFDGGNGTVAGNVSGNTLTGTSQKNLTVTIQFTLGGSGNTFDGNWDGSNKWCGARSGTAFASGCGYSGAWSTTLTGFPSCAMSLTQTDSTVTGTYCNGTITGSIGSFTSNAAVLTGQWHIAPSSGSIAFYLVGDNGLQFRGNFGGTNSWCGWRGGASAPSPCKYP